ncbi:MAG: hypothetical protein D6737_03435 [Chloroflexi bacterium]|nr:MAG: hypothetical protein CUN54_04210 [Phototrophicales bacterium]RMF81935.1 MAG: hypothetical protein D6737_03435 [Chloroflexota bacterium]
MEGTVNIVMLHEVKSMFHLTQQIALQQLDELGKEIRLVIAHPNYYSQHLLLDHAIQGSNTIYIRFDGAELDYDTLCSQFEQAVMTQTGTQKLASATIVLDECDRAESEAFDKFLIEIANHTGIERIYVIGRAMPGCVMHNGLREQTRVIPSEAELMLWDYTQRDEDMKLLEVRALGAGRVLLDGQEIAGWDGALPCALFHYLVDRGMVTRSEIFETFWPNLSTREATNVFHVTKRKISEVLGTDLTVYRSGFYHLSPHIQLSYDVALFSELIQNSAVAPLDERIALLQRAQTLYRGDFLSKLDMAWVIRRREGILQTYTEGVTSLAKAMSEIGQYDKALSLYLQASSTNPAREDITREIMYLYQQLQLPDAALKVYERLTTQLQETLGVMPAPETRELAETIINQR